MEKPMKFITTDDRGMLCLNPDVQPLLNDLNGVSAISVIGKYRTGKSYILNRFANSNTGFDLGNTVQAHTKGIWIWIRPHPVHKDLSLILLDIEGLSNVTQGNQTHYMKLFCLAILLSKVMLYNVMRVIDNSMIQDLNLVTELTKHLKVESKTEREDGAAFKLHFPCLVFLIRDSDLRLEGDDGRKISPQEYLDDILTPVDDVTDALNKQITCITQFFINKKCYTLCKPVDDDEKLQRIDKLSDDHIKAEFLKQSKIVIEEVLNEARQLVIQEVKCDGKGYWELASTFIQAMNKNKVTCIESAADILKDVSYRQACSKAIEGYIENMDIQMPISFEELKRAHGKAQEHAHTIFNQEVFFDDKDKSKSFLDRLQEEYQNISTKNDEESVKKCKSTIEVCFKELNSKFDYGEYYCGGGYKMYIRDRDQAKQAYAKEKNKGPKDKDELNKYLDSKKAEEMAVINVDKIYGQVKKTEENREEILNKKLSKLQETQAKHAKSLERLANGCPENIDMNHKEALEYSCRMMLEDVYFYEEEKDMKKQSCQDISRRNKEERMADTTVPVGDRATVPVEPFKVMLIGNAGAGKSSTGNMILSGDGEAVSTYFTVAEIDDAGQTREPKVWMRTVLGYSIEIIDTKGVVDRTNREFNTHLKCIFDKQGVDAVLIVIPCRSNPHLLNKRDRDSVKYMTNLCGDEFWKHCIFVLTYGNTFHDYVSNKSPIPTFEQEMSAHRFNVFNKDRFDAWKEKAKGGAVLFENTETNLQKRLEMVTNLLEKVEFLRAINEGKQLRPKIPQRKWYKFGV